MAKMTDKDYILAAMADEGRELTTAQIAFFAGTLLASTRRELNELCAAGKVQRGSTRGTWIVIKDATEAPVEVMDTETALIEGQTAEEFANERLAGNDAFAVESQQGEGEDSSLDHAEGDFEDNR